MSSQNVVDPTSTNEKTSPVLKNRSSEDYIDVPISFKRLLTPAEVREMKWPVHIVTSAGMSNSTGTDIGSWTNQTLASHNSRQQPAWIGRLTEGSHLVLMSRQNHLDLIKAKAERIVLWFFLSVSFLLLFFLYSNEWCGEHPDRCTAYKHRY